MGRLSHFTEAGQRRLLCEGDRMEMCAVLLGAGTRASTEARRREATWRVCRAAKWVERRGDCR